MEQLLRMQHEMLASERRRGTEELRGTQSAIDQQVQGMREELARLNRLVEDTERDRREHVGELTSQLQAAGRQTQVLTETTQSLREALSSTTARGQWGERMAEDVLQLAGFVDGINYRRHQALPGLGRHPRLHVPAARRASPCTWTSSSRSTTTCACSTRPPTSSASSARKEFLQGRAAPAP